MAAEVKVWARDAQTAKLIVHPVGGRFPINPANPTIWPRDQFTMKRLREGTVLDHPPVVERAATPPPPKQPE